METQFKGKVSRKLLTRLVGIIEIIFEIGLLSWQIVLHIKFDEFERNSRQILIEILISTYLIVATCLSFLLIYSTVGVSPSFPIFSTTEQSALFKFDVYFNVACHIIKKETNWHDLVFIPWS